MTLSRLRCICRQADFSVQAAVACSLRVTRFAEGGSAQSIDPVLEHLMHNARSDAVRQEFLRGDLAELIDHHEIRLLVGNLSNLPWCPCIIQPIDCVVQSIGLWSGRRNRPPAASCISISHCRFLTASSCRWAHTTSTAASRPWAWT